MVRVCVCVCVCVFVCRVYIWWSQCVVISQDIRKINMIAVKAVNTGMIILGGGVIKHHICNANLMVRNCSEWVL